MSVLELEQQVRTLPPAELARFGQWFDDFRNKALATTPGIAVDQDLTVEHETELRRRMILAREHPDLLEPWEGTVQQLRQELDAYRAEKASGRPA